MKTAVYETGAAEDGSTAKAGQTAKNKALIDRNEAQTPEAEG